ncbi:hypothetical protein CYMTET_7809 [Cymbomonas tetramitiformis]|uniref:HAT C-terminal dimerisation domain-containing protein n=1 Tax=Cymbomonas tetramitiformis TaxID=36881 RepID=A0AAE0LGQ0_9CHLO|nr:hypothetical protein CYMTET_7809 [Cymbomonas tetramitiformis]|eukprot:gene5052-6153_t
MASTKSDTAKEQYKYMVDNMLLFLAEGEHIGQLWVREDIKSKFSLLHRVAMAFLCIDPTSAESERNFSSAGRLIDDLRCSLNTWKVEAKIFLHKNPMHIDGFKDMPKPKTTT